MSVNKLIYVIKPNVLGRYEKYFIFIITYSSSFITKSNKLQTYGKFKPKICFEEYLFVNLEY